MLTSNYAPRSGSAESGAALLGAWWLVLKPLAGRWLTNGVFRNAVRETLAAGFAYLPTVAEFVDVCAGERDDLAREARAALPAPAESEPDPDAMARYRALVKAAARRGRWLEGEHQRIVGAGVGLGHRLGTDALRDYVRREYAAAVAASRQKMAASAGEAAG